MLEIPSVASPTEVFRSCITHGSNGFLAHSPDEWYVALRRLIVDSALRNQMGQQAYKHAIKHYLPEVLGEQAVSVYRQICWTTEGSLGVDDDILTVLVLLSDLRHARGSLARAPALQRVGRTRCRVIVRIDHEPDDWNAEQAREAIVNSIGAGAELTIQIGGEVPVPISCWRRTLPRPSSPASRRAGRSGRRTSSRSMTRSPCRRARRIVRCVATSFRWI